MPDDQHGECDQDVQVALDALDDALYGDDPYTLACVSDAVLDAVDDWACTVQLHIAQARRRRRTARKDTTDAH